jgi:hypothetical protein
MEESLWNRRGLAVVRSWSQSETAEKDLPGPLKQSVKRKKKRMISPRAIKEVK